MSSRYEDLVAWQKAMSLATQSYGLAKRLPVEERYGLASQIRRSATSVPSNIAEGQGRMSKGEFLQFLGHARGSLFELETQMRLAQSMDYFGMQELERFLSASSELKLVLNGLITSMSS